MNPLDARDLLLTTEYGVDKVMETISGSFSAGARIGAFTPRLTNEPRSQSAGTYGLVNGSYSFDNSTWYPFGVSVADTSGSLPTFQTIEVNAYCTDTQVIIQASNWTTSSATVYYALQVLSRE